MTKPEFIECEIKLEANIDEEIIQEFGGQEDADHGFKQESHENK